VTPWLDQIDTREATDNHEAGTRDPVATETPAEYFGSAQCQHPVGSLHANICVRASGRRFKGALMIDGLL
jgi:hypothetical protein